MSLTRRHLFGLLTGTAAYAVAPEPLRRYFIIGQPERRFVPFDVMAASTLRLCRREMRRAVMMHSLLWHYCPNRGHLFSLVATPKYDLRLARA